MKRSPICVHYWLIDSDNEGTCRKCGKTKRFPTMAEVSEKALEKGNSSAAKGLKASHGVKHKTPSKKLRAQQKREADLRRQATERAGGRCEKCGKVAELEMHHIKPKRMGGTTYQYSLAEVIMLCNADHARVHGQRIAGDKDNGK